MSYDKPKQGVSTDSYAIVSDNDKALPLTKVMETMLRALPDPVFVVDRQGRFVYVGEVGARLLGRSVEEYLGKTVRDMGFAPEVTANLVAYTEQVIHTGQPTVSTDLIPTRNGSRWYEHQYTPLLDDRGEVAGMLCIARDVNERVLLESERVQRQDVTTARQEAEDALQASEERYRLLVEQTVDGIFLADPEGNYIDVSPSGCKMFGMTREEFLKSAFTDVLAPEEHDRLALTVKNFADGKIHREEWRFRRKDGSTFVGELIGSQLPDGRFHSIVRDVTERKQAEERLRIAHDTFHHLVENSPFGIYAIDADFRLVQVSVGAQKVFENVRPLIGRDLAEVLRILWPEPFASEAIQRFRHTLETGGPYHAPSTIERRQDSGEVESYDWKIEQVTMPDGRFGAVCHFYDLSERQRYEAELRQSEERFRIAENASHSFVYDWNITTGIEERSDGFTRMLGYSNAELPYGGAAWEALIHPEDVVRVRTLTEAALTERPSDVRVEYRLRHKNGSWLWVVDEFTVIRDEQGEVQRVVGSIVDISVLKQQQQEIVDLNTRLQRAVAETHHRVKNNLQMLSALVEMQIPSADTLMPASSLHRIGQHIRTLASLHDLLTLDSKTVADNNTVSLKEALEKLIPLLQTTADKRQIRICAEEMEATLKQGGSFVLLVNELLSNAFKHGKGEVEIKLSLASATEEPGGISMARLEVSDDGPGFPPEFDPIRAANTGLELIESLGRWDLRGQIAYTNRAEGGACVIVTFPLSEVS